jgi:uncharacterized protein YkwD
MSVTITLAFASMAEAAAFLSSDKPKADAATPAPKSAKTEKAAASPSSAAPAAAPVTPPSVAPSAPPAAPAVKYEDTGIGELIQKMVQKDRAAAIALLGKYKAKKGSELLPDQFDAFKAEITEALATEESLG